MILLNQNLSEEEIGQLVASVNLERLPSFSIKRVFDLPPYSGAGIYFVMLRGVIVYIGQSSSISGRWLCHSLRRVRRLRMSSVAYLLTRCSDQDRRRLEREFITRYQPTLNRTWAA